MSSDPAIERTAKLDRARMKGICFGIAFSLVSTDAKPGCRKRTATSRARVLLVKTVNGAASTNLAPLVVVVALLALAGCGGQNSNNGGGSPPPPPLTPATVNDTVSIPAIPSGNGDYLSGVAVDSNTNKAYVVNTGTLPCIPGDPPSGVVTIIDGVTDLTNSSTSIEPLETCQGPGCSTFETNLPDAIAVDPATGKAYIHLFGIPVQDCQIITGTSVVVSFDLMSEAATGLFPEPPMPGFDDLGHNRLAVNANTGKLYLANNTGTVSTSGVVVFDFATNSIVSTITDPNGIDPVGVAVNPTTNTIYVANGGTNNVSVIDGSTNSVVATMSDPKAVKPFGVAVNSTTNTVYVANEGSNNVTVMNGQTNSIITTIAVGTSPVAVDVNPMTNFIYVANAGVLHGSDLGNISVIDGQTNSMTTLTDPKGINPTAVAVNSASNRIYVANSGSNNVTVIAGAHK